MSTHATFVALKNRQSIVSDCSPGGKGGNLSGSGPSEITVSLVKVNH